MAIGEDEFRHSLAAWPSGVTVLTSRSGDRIHGMTVSDFSGASLSPPLVAVCCQLGSITTDLIAESDCFGVNVLAADQVEISNRFASKKYEHVRFETVPYTVGLTGSPLLEGAVVNLDCKVVSTYAAGDHVIYLGQVESSEVHDRQPLVYWKGGYREMRIEEDK
ncbi:MAG: flavin reductase [Deltaproteobacteria bacterium]|nr:flavin reductase [Deltaproteobacteria bacterium]